jgi:enamine deaminase RidA (YjgF/YER057c/UK114 family)
MTRRVLHPEGWPPPKGYANGIAATGTVVAVGGQVGWDPVTGAFPEGFVAQTAQALRNIVAVLKEAGAGPEHLVRLTWYVTDINHYFDSLAALGKAYREVMGRSYPAMALVQVVRLVEPDALVEIEATAVVALES